MDYKLLNYALKLDGAYVNPTKKNLVVTCLDQMDEEFEFDKLEMKFDTLFGSFSPYSKDFKRLI